MYFVPLKGQQVPLRSTLYTNIGDGYAAFEVDAFGDFRGCGANGILFDPLGAFGPKQTDCHSALYMFDQARTRRSSVTADWSYYAQCGATEQIPTLANISHDSIVGTHTRISRFTIPEFPELEFRLEQVACGNKLVQTYSVTNVSPTDMYIRFARVGDLDLEFTSNFTRNYGGEYPLGAASPTGGIILDQSTLYGVAFTSPTHADAIFEGWRVQVGGAGAFGFSATWGNYGYSTTPYPGVNGDGLNGMWSNPGALTPNGGLCTVDATDAPLAATFADYYGVRPARDMSLIIQSRLDIPAGQTRDYVTETIAEPGSNCCQGPDCGTISGAVNLDAGACAAGGPVGSHMVTARDQVTLLSYHALTNGNGNYMINAPFGTYDIQLDPIQNAVCTPVLVGRTVDAGTPSIINQNLKASDNCDAEWYITGSYPGNVMPDGCGILPLTPCPGDTFQYCYTIVNTGTSPIEAGSKFDFSIPGGMTILGISSTAGCWQPINNNFVFLDNDLPVNASCEFCVDVLVDANATPPWVAAISSTNNVECINGEPLVTSAELEDTVSCSCDPNVKTAYPLGCGPDHNIGLEDITYSISFHNIGALPADRVRVIDQIDADLDLTSLRILESAYPLTDVRIHPVAGNPGQFEIHFIYDDMNLAPISLDPRAIGRIVYRIAPKAGLADGTRLDNVATIYFDDNPPIATNAVFHTYKDEPVPIVSLGAVPTLYLGYEPECAHLEPVVTGGTPPYQYEWSNGETLATISVCPDSSMTYEVTVTDAQGCSGAANVAVEVVDVRCGQNMDKVIVCHNGHEICVSPAAVPSHLAHGDILGPCNTMAKWAGTLDGDQSSFVFELYPNPVGDAATLTIRVPEATRGSLQLFNLEGKRLQTMFEGELGVAVLSQQLDFSAIPGGLYLAMFQTESGIMKTVKISVVK